VPERAAAGDMIMRRKHESRATVGDAVRRSERELRAARSISPLAGAIGISREFLYRVLAGDEWTWPRGPRTRPPGSRLPDTPVTTLAACTVDGHQGALLRCHR